MRAPNGYGTVVKLSGNRRRPYAVKKLAGRTAEGQPRYDIVGYTATKEDGLILLAQYNRDPWDIDQSKITLAQLYDLWLQRKAPKLGQSTQKVLKSCWNYLQPLSGKPYRSLRAYHMQDVIDDCPRSASMKNAIRSLWRHLDDYALEIDVINKQYSGLLTSAVIPDTKRQPFTPEEVERVWQHLGDVPSADLVLILLYSGWRISELLALTPADIDLTAGTMTGGTKTAAGKNRVVPIHHRIRPLIEARLAEGHDTMVGMTDRTFRATWSQAMDALGMDHVPHECRHTFETLLDAAGGNRRCIDLLMGHASKGTGNRVYNHKTIEQLKSTVELLK